MSDGDSEHQPGYNLIQNGLNSLDVHIDITLSSQESANTQPQFAVQCFNLAANTNECMYNPLPS